MKNFILPLFLISGFVFSQAPNGYYNGTSGLTGYVLKSKLHEIISKNNVNWNYRDLPNFYNQTDLDIYYDHDATNTTFLLDLYSERPLEVDAYEYTSADLISTSSAEGLGYNREHVVPQSTFKSNYPMYSDLHFVIPTDARINQLRNNYPYGVGGSTVYYTFTNTSKMAKSAIPNYIYNNRVYEPIDEFKGDIARMLLYFAVRYEDKLPSFNHSTNINPALDRSALDGTSERAFEPAYINMLLQWHAQDPVSQREIDRNNSVYSIQNNRNPFVDHPDWVNVIWSQGADALAPESPSNLMIVNTGAYYIDLSWQPSTSSGILGYNVYQNDVLVKSTKSTSVNIDHLNPSTSYSFKIKAYNNGYLESPESNIVTVSTLSSDASSKDLFIAKYIEGTEYNKALEIMNKTGHDVDLNNYSIRVQYYNSASNVYYYGNSFELEGKIPNNESFVVLNPRATLSCYTNNDVKFVTAGDALDFSGTQYVELVYKSTTVDAIGSRYVSNSNSNISLYRKNTVSQPNASFTSNEWNYYGMNYCENPDVLSTSKLVSGKEDYIKIYPNPVREKIFFTGRIENVKKAQIIDASGKMVYSENLPFKNKNSISVESLSSGIYLLRLDGKTYHFIKD